MANKYYLLDNSTGDDVGNVFPQTDGLPIGYDRDSETSMTKLRSHEFPRVAPDLRFNLAPKALLTNVVGVGNVVAVGLLVDEKLRRILDEFNIMRHAFYDATVMAHGIRYRYYWLHIVPEDHSGIDFKRSRFATYEASFFQLGKISNVECGSEEELIHHIDNTPGFGLEKIMLTPEFMAKQYDMFFFPRISTNPVIIISDRLCQRLIEEEITGIVIMRQDVVDF